MWDWILRIVEPPQEQDLITRIAALLASHHGWNLTGGWRQNPRYWWALKGCVFSYGKLNTEGLFYFFQCSTAEFNALARQIREQAWNEGVKQLTAVLRVADACQFNQYRPDEATLLVEALSACRLHELLRAHLPERSQKVTGSKEALEAWVKSEYVRQYAKRG